MAVIAVEGTMNGDHLMGVPFECDLCSFRNVVGRDPVLGDYNDHFTLVAI